MSKRKLKLIDRDATEIVQQLQTRKKKSYLVGGCVRDIYLGHTPKDYDIATEASPQEVKALVRRASIIGKRFRIVLAKRRANRVTPSKNDVSFIPSSLIRPVDKEFQITTFRRKPEVYDGKLNENVFGSPREDATRRDFTVNSLFLDPVTGEVIDFLGGLKDIHSKTLRVIGDPEDRFTEDPIRILRALRFLGRYSFKLAPKDKKAFEKCIPCLLETKRERVREEILKALKERCAKSFFTTMDRKDLWKQINPPFARYLERNSKIKAQLLQLAEAIDRCQWNNPRTAAPLLYLLHFTLIHDTSKGRSEYQEAIMDEFKVSKLEKEQFALIRSMLKKLEKDPEGSKAPKLLHSSPRSIDPICQSFYVLKILGLAKVGSYAKLWKTWEKPWIDYTKHLEKRKFFVESGRGSARPKHRHPTRRNRRR